MIVFHCVVVWKNRSCWSRLELIKARGKTGFRGVSHTVLKLVGGPGIRTQMCRGEVLVGVAPWVLVGIVADGSSEGGLGDDFSGFS